jgi:hypothetical protein
VDGTAAPSWADNGVASSAADAWLGVKLAASRPKQSPLTMIVTTERTLAERWCGNVAKRRKPILFLLVVIDYPNRRKSRLPITQRFDLSCKLP